MALDPNRFTRKTQEAFAAAQALARDAGNTEIAPEHLLRALLDQSEGIVSGVIERIGVDLAAVRRKVDEQLAKLPRVSGATVRDARLSAEGDLDFRGTLGVDKEAPVGFRQIRLTITLDTPASEQDQEKLLSLTERYCVVYQTLRQGVDVRVAVTPEPPGVSPA